MNFWARFPCRIWAHEKLPFFLSVGIAVTFETPPILHLYQFLPIRHRPHSIEPRHRNHCQMSREGRREGGRGIHQKTLKRRRIYWRKSPFWEEATSIPSPPLNGVERGDGGRDKKASSSSIVGSFVRGPRPRGEKGQP